MKFKFLSLSCLALICLSGCFFLPQSLKTLKSVGDSQKEIEIYLARQVDLFNKMLTDLNNGNLSPGISKDKFIRIYGEPILSKRVFGPPGEERLLYRHPTKYFQSDRIYIYFDEKERLTRWEYEPYK